MIEERQKLQTHLRTSNRAARKRDVRRGTQRDSRFRTMIERNADAILIVDRSGTIRFANPAAERVFRCDREDLVGEAFGSPLVEGESTEIEVLRCDGRTLIGEMRAVGISWDGDPCHLISLRDISQRKEAEARIRHLNAVLRAIRNVNQVIARADDRDALIHAVCDQLAASHGYFNAWIALFAEPLDAAHLPSSYPHIDLAAAGGGDDTFAAVIERCESPEPFHCLNRALRGDAIMSTLVDPTAACPECPFASHYQGRGAMIGRLQHGGSIYGILVVSTPRDFVNDAEERSLFKEVSRDIGLALHDLDAERRRLKAERRLRRSLERLEELEQIINRSPAIAFLWKAETGWPVAYVSENVRQFGYTAATFYEGGRSFRSLIHPEDRERVTREVERFSQKGVEEFSQEYRILDDRGEIHWVDDRTFVAYDDRGSPLHYEGILLDITQRRRAEAALRASERRYRTVFDHAGDAVFVHDLDGCFLDVNRVACERLGYSREELLEMRPQDIDASEDASRIPERMERLRRDGHVVFEVAHVRRDGSVVPVEISSRYIEYDGRPAILSMARDITNRKEAEAQVKHYAAALKKSNQELERFAYVVSHDLREPLRVISSYLQLLEQRYGDELDGKAEVFIDYAVDGANRMQEMIRALLDLSRVETRGRAFEPTDVNVVLERALAALKRAVVESDAEIDRGPMPVVVADGAQLRQVFQNLIANAIKFRRKEAPPKVNVTAYREEGVWHFAVQDNGIGIDPEQSDRLFQIFRRLHTRDEYPGIGIGLALCRRVIERHGGRIWVESEPGIGSTFIFTLRAGQDERSVREEDSDHV